VTRAKFLKNVTALRKPPWQTKTAARVVTNGRSFYSKNECAGRWRLKNAMNGRGRRIMFMALEKNTGRGRIMAETCVSRTQLRHAEMAWRMAVSGRKCLCCRSAIVGGLSVNWFMSQRFMEGPWCWCRQAKVLHSAGIVVVVYYGWRRCRRAMGSR